MSRRAELLAARIEEGAGLLAAFAEALPASDWYDPMPANGSDRRTVAAIVHHVASVYPIEVDLARQVAQGKAVLEVSWDAVARMNAAHGQEQAAVPREVALELLRKNSRAAAEAVRRFTDEELDTAAPFSLSYGAPVTAQFVLEDHAVRHSWHHLAKLRAGLGR